MQSDPELKAMTSIAAALEGLDPDVTRRVLRWAGERYGVKIPMQEEPQGGTAASSAGNGSGAEAFSDIASLMDAANPKYGSDKALVATYWFQVLNREQNVTGQQVNDELKNLGLGLSNVTDSFNTLINRKPALAQQVQKAGRSKQARKRYRLTEAGVRRVRALLAGQAEE
jgi:hypothetical protein